MNFLGIDPGKSGGIAVIGHDGAVIDYCLKNKTERDIFGFMATIRWNSCFQGDADSRQFFAVVERVSSSPQMGVKSAFTFGQGYGYLRGVLVAAHVPFDEVTPQKWQKFMGCLTKGDKNVSKAKAQQLFPNIKVTHGNADALLLAEYARRMYGSWTGEK